MPYSITQKDVKVFQLFAKSLPDRADAHAKSTAELPLNNVELNCIKQLYVSTTAFELSYELTYTKRFDSETVTQKAYRCASQKINNTQK